MMRVEWASLLGQLLGQHDGMGLLHQLSRQASSWSCSGVSRGSRPPRALAVKSGMLKQGGRPAVASRGSPWPRFFLLCLPADDDPALGCPVEYINLKVRLLGLASSRTAAW